MNTFNLIIIFTFIIISILCRISLLTVCDGVIQVSWTRPIGHASSNRVLPTTESIPDPVAVPRIRRHTLRGCQLGLAALDCRHATPDPLSALVRSESGTDNGHRGFVVGIWQDALAEILGDEEKGLVERWLRSQCLSSREEVMVAEGARTVVEGRGIEELKAVATLRVVVRFDRK